MSFENFISIDYLSSFMGTVIITMLLVQFFKELPLVKGIPTKYFTFIVALVNILSCQIILGSFKVGHIYLILINAVLVTFTATGGYDFSLEIPKKMIKEKE